jgi:hypothetical protein
MPGAGLLALLLLGSVSVTVGAVHAQFPEGVNVQTRELDGGDPLWGRSRVTIVEGTDARGVSYRLVRVTSRARPRWPRRRTDLLRRWRAAHACTAVLVDVASPLRRGARPPPQITFAGSCEGGDRYVTRLLSIDGLIYELHVDQALRANAPAVSDAELREAFARLVGLTRLGS